MLERSESYMRNQRLMKDWTKEQVDDFYSNKFNYYKEIAHRTVILAMISCPTSWLFDCFMVKGVSIATLLTRLFPLILLIPYLAISENCNYKIVNAISYTVLYVVGISTIMSIAAIDSSATVYISSLMIINQIWFLLYGMCISAKKSIWYHLVIMLEIIVACMIVPRIDPLMVMMLQSVTYCMIEYTLNILSNNYIDNYIISREIELMMIHDQLTGAFNRNKLTELCSGKTNELEINRAGVLILDIDFFKSINDTFGHETGDRVLQNLVSIIKNSVRKSDYVIRWGGEEFIVLLPDCGESRTEAIAEKIRLEVQKYGDNMCNATVSVGATVYNGGDYHKAVRRADKALYYCKEHGRNQVKVYDDSLANLESDK